MSYEFVAIATAILVIAATILIYFAPNIFGGAGAGSSRQQKLADEARKFMAQVIGIIFVIFTLSWSLIKDSQTFELAINQAAIEQYSKSIELLKETEAIVKAGGIFSLGNLATSHHGYSDQVYRTVHSFINSYPPPPVENGTTRPAFVGIAINAAIIVLGGRPPIGKCPEFVDHLTLTMRFSSFYLAGGDFRGSNGFRCADFQNATLFGAQMQGAMLEGAHFGGAKMADWEAYDNRWNEKTEHPGKWNNDIAHTKQWKDWERLRYVVNFTDAELAGAQFTGTSLAGAIFNNANLDQTNFTDMNLSRVSFANARSFDKAKFKDCCADDPPDFGNWPYETRPNLDPCQKRLQP